MITSTDFEKNGYFLADFKTKEKVTADDLVFTGPDGPWEVVMDMERVRSRLNPVYFKQAPPAMLKYLPLMPIAEYDKFVTVGEGATPLIRSSRIGEELGVELYFKLENQNPTGAFKDRGSAVELTIAREFGAKGVVVASTGNMAASCSCYAAAAHIPCFVFAPEGTPAAKLAQVIAFGGKIVQVQGSYGDAAALAFKVAKELGFYLAGDYAFRVEGHKTAAYELVEQLFYRPPQMVVVPMGCGTNMASYYKGFREYQELGFIRSMPRLIGTQAEGASTISGAFAAGLTESIDLEKAETIAGAICINKALDGAKALDAIYGSNGTALALSDREILEAQYRLSREEGLFVEAACASTVAGLYRMAANGELQPGRIVCVLTGAGLKDPTTVLKIAVKPPTIQPRVADFLDLYQRSFFEGKNVAFVDKSQVVFAQEPSVEEVAQTTTRMFGTKYAEHFIKNMQSTIARFLTKGKPVTCADFQDIVQDTLETSSKKFKPLLSVTDFSVTTGRNARPRASVEIVLKGKSARAEALGVGPFDAIMNALKSACGGDFPFELVDYSVDIRSSGTDAGVRVELKLSSESVISLGAGTSPDIIQASVEAFEQAYNGFFAESGES